MGNTGTTLQSPPGSLRQPSGTGDTVLRCDHSPGWGQEAARLLLQVQLWWGSCQAGLERGEGPQARAPLGDPWLPGQHQAPRMSAEEVGGEQCDLRPRLAPQPMR